MLCLYGQLAQSGKVHTVKLSPEQVTASKQPMRNGPWTMLTPDPWLAIIGFMLAGLGQNQAKDYASNSAND